MNCICKIGRLGAIISLKALKEKLITDVMYNKFIRSLTTVEIPTHGKPKYMANKSIKAYMLFKIKDEVVILIPAVMCDKLRIFNKITIFDNIIPDNVNEVNFILPNPQSIAERAELNPQCKLYGYQIAVVDYLCDGVKFGNTRGRVYLQMDTGLGKTRVGCAIVARRAVAAIIVVPTDAIAQQWLEEFKITYPQLRTIIYRNSLKNVKNINATTYDVLIIIINTFRDKTMDFIVGFGTMILDEAHELHSLKNHQALWLAQTDAVLGLSATPCERKDGLDKYINLHLGDIIKATDIPGFDTADVNFNTRVKMIEYHGHPDSAVTGCSAAGTSMAIMTIGNIITDVNRTNMLANEILLLANMHLRPDANLHGVGLNEKGIMRKHGIFVFAEHRDYLVVLAKAISTQMPSTNILVPEIENISVLLGGVAADAVGNAKVAGAHIVLTTYGFSRRGISLPEMTCLVMATPRRNGIRQIIGRILRRGSDESIIRQIIDVVDVCTSIKSQSTDRKAVYRERGYPIEKTVIHWGDLIANTDNTANTNNTDNMVSKDLSKLSKEELLEILQQKL